MAFDGRWRNMNSEVLITLRLNPQSPLLIQAPKEETDDNVIQPVTYKKGRQEIYYIPGSTIKGVFRARSEKIFYHLFKEELPGKENKVKVEQAKDFYENLSAVHQLFGHSVFRGRASIDDAIFDSKTVQVSKRTHIAVDRFRGGSKDGALFETECITEGSATATIRLKNCEAWQIVWLCFLIRDLQEGYITLGAKSGIGFGTVKAELENASFHIYNTELKKEWKSLLEKGTENEKKGLYPVYNFSSLETIASSLEPYWLEFVEAQLKKVEAKVQ